MDRLERLLHAMRDVRDCADPVADEIDELVAADPAHSRAVILAHTGDEVTRLWALGRLGDPLDLPAVAAALTDPALRHVAMEALGGIRDAAGVDAVARPLLADPDPVIRAMAVGIVAFHARPGAVAALVPLAADPDPDVRMRLAWRLGALPGPEPELALRTLLTDPVRRVRTFAARGLARRTARGLTGGP
ncbi:HEAT repeat domain-containing protein [Dactylosporangium sp. NPDC050588]|uniref:HEAT repeat domain-containing protein n=1 Tax=Dactylosporangium sp. NPDC050588 TaxID=3157211 RepID=UPI0033FFA419